MARSLWELFKSPSLDEMAKLCVGKNYLQRAVNHFYPLELSFDTLRPYNPKRKCLIKLPHEFLPVRNAAAAAKLHIQDIAQEQDQH